MMEHPLIIEVCLRAVLIFGSGLVFIQPLRKRENWKRWVPVMFVLCLLCMWLNYQTRGVGMVVSHLVQYLCLVFMVNRCTKMSLSGDCYCAVWAFVSCEAVYEMWTLFRYLTPALHASPTAQIISVLLFSLAAYLILNRTLARWMPQKDIYQIGPRQLSSAIVLWIMFTTVAYYLLSPQNRYINILLVLIMCQIYCVSLLYLQTELFKKSQMQKDIDALNFLYSCEQKQYEIACQNVRIVSRKCEELDQMINTMQQYLPEDLRQDMKSPITDAMRSCDTILKSGNSVLDIVLAEKKMLADAKGIQINCVADGKLLNFMEVVDIYAVFSNALDNAIEAVAGLSNSSHRLIDVLVHESQNFVVINFSNPLKDSLEFDEGLPVTTKTKNSFHGYGLKMLRRAIEKYHGIFTIEAAGGFFTLKILIPLP